MDTLHHCLSALLEHDYDNFGILVSDNASRDGTEDTVASFNSPKIEYVNTGSRVSMTENWEYALSHVSHGWITFIGDDDGLVPGGLST